jgi:hypothetical protein
VLPWTEEHVHLAAVIALKAQGEFLWNVAFADNFEHILPGAEPVKGSHALTCFVLLDKVATTPDAHDNAACWCMPKAVGDNDRDNPVAATVAAPRLAQKRRMDHSAFIALQRHGQLPYGTVFSGDAQGIRARAQSSEDRTPGFDRLGLAVISLLLLDPDGGTDEEVTGDGVVWEND